jgi:hypothetical protein
MKLEQIPVRDEAANHADCSGEVAQVAERLPSNHETLSSNSSAEKKKCRS